MNRVPGASGKLVVDGAGVSLHGAARSEAGRLLMPGSHRVEAVLTSARGRPGVWSFRLGGIRPGTLRVLSGEAARISADAVVFHLRGAAGERVTFTFETGR